jgi:hypothetical protein
LASQINASNSGFGGIVSTGDSSGVLQLQTAGTTAVTIDTSQRAAFVAGTAALPAITTTGDTNTGMFFPAADTIAFAEGGTEAMRLDSSGNVGIGTSSPGQKLQISNTSSSGFAAIRMAADSRSYDVGVGGSASGFQQNNWYIYDGTAAATRMVIDSNGYVTKPYQVAFNAYNASSGNPVLWATANLNIGSAYNTSTGRFTAPIAGRYLIYISLHAQAGLGRVDFRLQVNGSDREGGAASQSTTYTQGTGIAILQLAASDYVTVNALATFSNVQALSYFGGYLLG